MVKERRQLPKILLIFPEPHQLSREIIGITVLLQQTVSEAGVGQGAKPRHVLRFVNAYG